MMEESGTCRQEGRCQIQAVLPMGGVFPGSPVPSPMVFWYSGRTAYSQHDGPQVQILP